MKSNNKIINDNLKSNTQRQIQNTDLLMTLWHTFSIRSNKDMRWVVLISFKSLNWHIKRKKLSKVPDLLEENNQFTLFTRVRAMAKTWRAQYRSICILSFFSYTTYCYFFSSFLASYSGNVVSNAERWLNSFIHCQNCDNWRTLLIWRGTMGHNTTWHFEHFHVLAKCKFHCLIKKDDWLVSFSSALNWVCSSDCLFKEFLRAFGHSLTLNFNLRKFWYFALIMVPSGHRDIALFRSFQTSYYSRAWSAPLGFKRRI